MLGDSDWSKLVSFFLTGGLNRPDTDINFLLLHKQKTAAGEDPALSKHECVHVLSFQFSSLCMMQQAACGCHPPSLGANKCSLGFPFSWSLKTLSWE